MSQIIPYLAPGALTNTQSDVTDLQSLSGVPDDSVNLGTFTGSTIPDNQTTKQALQALETEVEDRLPDFVRWQRKDGGYRLSSTANLSTPINDFGTSDFSFLVALQFDSVPSSTQTLLGKTATANSWRFYADGSGYRLQVLDAASASTIYTFSVPVTTSDRVATITLDRDGNAVLYINGEQKASVSISGSSGINFGNGAANTLLIGNASSGPAATIREVRLFNRLLSATDVAKYSRGEATDFSDRVANTSDLQTGSWFNSTSSSFQFSNFSGSSTGFSADYNNANASNRAVIELSRTLVVGRKYRAEFSADTDGTGMTFGIANTTAGGQPVGGVSVISSSVSTPYSLEFVATSAQIYMVFLTTNPPASGSIAVSNFTLKEIGAVAEYLPESSTPTIWADVSPLGRHATNNGATHIFNRRLYADAFVQFTNLPTSSAGLATGRVWNDSGTLKIV